MFGSDLTSNMKRSTYQHVFIHNVNSIVKNIYKYVLSCKLRNFFVSKSYKRGNERICPSTAQCILNFFVTSCISSLSQQFFESDRHLPYARLRNMRESALAVLLAWTLAAQQGLCGKLEKIVQQPSNVLVDYYAYRHISIIHFNVPERTVAVVFKYVLNRERIFFLYLTHAVRENVSMYLNVIYLHSLIILFNFGSILKNLYL